MKLKSASPLTEPKRLTKSTPSPTSTTTSTRKTDALRQSRLSSTAKNNSPLPQELTPGVTLHPLFTRLDQWHIRHDETGLVIHWGKRKLVDPTGGMYNRQFRNLSRALKGHVIIYEALKRDDVQGNWVQLADTGLSQYLNLTSLVMCPYCKLFCNPNKGNHQFQDHLLHVHGKENAFTKTRVINCKGAFFYGNVKQSSYYVLTDIDMAGHGRQESAAIIAIEKSQQRAVLELQRKLSNLAKEKNPDGNKNGGGGLRDGELVIRKRVHESVRKAAASFREIELADEVQDETKSDVDDDKEKEIRAPAPAAVEPLQPLAPAPRRLLKLSAKDRAEMLEEAARADADSKLHELGKNVVQTSGLAPLGAILNDFAPEFNATLRDISIQSLPENSSPASPVKSTELYPGDILSEKVNTHDASAEKSTGHIDPIQTPRKNSTTSFSKLLLLSSPCIDHSTYNVKKRTRGVSTTQSVATMLEDIDYYSNEMIRSLNENLESEISGLHLEIPQLMNDYLTDPLTSSTVLPYVLLDCITDDLWTVGEDIANYFKFILKGKGPQLLITNEFKNFSLSFVLSNSIKQGWSVVVSLDSTKDATSITTTTSSSVASGFDRSDKLETLGLSFSNMCEILVVLRVLIYTIISRSFDGDPLPGRSEMFEFLEKSFEEHRCGGGLSEKIVGELLYKHISRWK